MVKVSLKTLQDRFTIPYSSRYLLVLSAFGWDGSGSTIRVRLSQEEPARACISGSPNSLPDMPRSRLILFFNKNMPHAFSQHHASPQSGESFCRDTHAVFRVYVANCPTKSEIQRYGILKRQQLEGCSLKSLVKHRCYYGLDISYYIIRPTCQEHHLAAVQIEMCIYERRITYCLVDLQNSGM